MRTVLMSPRTFRVADWRPPRRRAGESTGGQKREHDAGHWRDRHSGWRDCASFEGPGRFGAGTGAGEFGSPAVQGLRDAGAEIVEADLKRPGSIADALRGATHVISTASSTLSRSEGDSIETVDRDGTLAAVAASAAAGIEQFVFVSFPPSSIPFPLQDAKRTVEGALQASGTAYTIVQPTHFWEVWCSPVLGFDAQARKARIFGDGTAR